MKTTRIIFDSGSENRILDAEAILKHLAACLRGVSLSGCQTIHLDPDGRVYVDGHLRYEPPAPYKKGQWHNKPEERELIR